MKHNRMLRWAAGDPIVQGLSHAGGGLGVGLVVGSFVDHPILRAILLMLGCTLLTVAVFGHWYAVWSDPTKLVDP